MALISAGQAGKFSVGEAYVIFGKATGWSASKELSSLDGSNGFVLNGIDANDFAGFSVSSAGDVNGDGFDDIIVGASLGLIRLGKLVQERFMLYSGRLPVGRRHWNYPHWTDPMGSCSMALMLTILLEFQSPSAGDVNRDGFDDIIVGANSADPAWGN